MVNLEGKNLCERHKELNLKVKEAAEKKIKLHEIKCEENSDVDRIFKIALASEYKDVTYILEELKSGDSLYISRVLKCKWLYASDYEHIINPDFLHHNVFSMMSIKMRKKMLTSIADWIKDETRAELFYEYCMVKGFKKNAFKFLIFTSENFKLKILKNKESCSTFFQHLSITIYHLIIYLKNLIGNSFTLANAYAENESRLFDFPYLYSVNKENYLDLLEKHPDRSTDQYIGIKTSRSIMKKYKDRVLQHARVYLPILNRRILLEYSSSDDAQIYLEALLPESENQFWESNFCKLHKDIILLLTTVSKFQFIKQIFERKYEKCDFEIDIKFFELEYQGLMTSKEHEAWALNQLQMHRKELQHSLLSVGDNYRWCAFLPFAEAVQLIHIAICETFDPDKRSAMLKVLVMSARSNKELEYLLNYYYNKHILEEIDEKGRFLENVIKYHNVFEFNEACWVAFDMILQNFQLYATIWPHSDFYTVPLIYRIIKDKTIPRCLQDFIKYGVYTKNFVFFLYQLQKEERDLVYEHMSNTLIKSIQQFENQNYDDFVKWPIRNFIEHLITCRRLFCIEDEYPDVVIKYMKLDFERFKHILGIRLKHTEGSLLRCLKKDSSQIVDILPSLIDEYINNKRFRINILLRKIKTFFPKDIAKQSLDFFTKALYGLWPNKASIDQRAIYGIVFAIFQLGDEKSKTELMDKFAPTNPKIEKDKMDNYDFNTQVAICRFQGYSRPPVPLCKTILYTKGDYLHKCEGMLYMYVSNVSPALRKNFIQVLLNIPPPVQNRGLDLVFQTLRYDDLKDLVTNLWNDTKNVKLRKKIYMVTMKRILNKKNEMLLDVFELLLQLTMTIQEDDDDDILAYFNGDKVPVNFRGSYLETCWKKVASWPAMNEIKKLKLVVARSILENRNYMNHDFLYYLLRGHIIKLFERKAEMYHKIKKPGELDIVLGSLMMEYICHLPDEAKQERSLKIVELVIEESFNQWNEEHLPSGLYYSQEFFYEFVDYIFTISFYFGPTHLRIVHIMERILHEIEKQIGITEMYARYWDWMLSLMTRKAINGKMQCDGSVFIDFGYHLSHFVNKLKTMNCYYISFSEKVFGKLLTYINIMDSQKYPWLTTVETSVLIAYGITTSKMDIFENYVLALKILPTSPMVTPPYRHYFLTVIQKIKTQNNNEFVAFLKDKFDESTEGKIRKVLESFKEK